MITNDRLFIYRTVLKQIIILELTLGKLVIPVDLYGNQIK